MAVKLITGNTFDAVAERVYGEIVNNGVNTGRHILFVPDQFALMSEMELLDYLGIVSSFNIEVYGFSRFARKMLANSDRVMLNQETSVMLLEKIILDSRAELTVYKSVAGKSGYVGEIYAVITSLRNSGIMPDRLVAASENMRGNMRDKIRDIAMLYSRYLSALATDYRDMGSELETLAKAIPDMEYLRGSHIYVTDMHEMTRVKLDIISALMSVAESFNIGVVDCPMAKNARIYPTYLADFVARQAERLGQSVVRINVTAPLGMESSVVADRLFSYYLSTDINSEGRYKICRADSQEAEVRGVAREIRRLVVESGYRYRDIAVVVSDIDGYGEDIRDIFRDFDIPYYMDNRSPLINTALARLYILAADAVSRNYRRGEVLSFVHSALLPLTYDERCVFELFVNKYNINYSRFTKPFDIGRDDNMYIVAENVRERVFSLLSKLDFGRMQAKNAVAEIRSFYADSVSEYDRYIARLRETDSIAADVATQAYEKIQSVLSQIEDILGEGEYSCEEISQIVTAIFAGAQISTAPQYIDSVFVGTENKSKYSGVRALFIMGANEGNYPSESREKGILGSAEMEMLERQGIEFFPNNREKYCLDRFYIEQLLLKASDSVTVTYNRQAGGACIMVGQLLRLLNLNEENLNGENIGTDTTVANLAAKIGTAINGTRELLQYYGERMSGQNSGNEDVYDYLYTRISDKLDNRILAEREIADRVTPHRLMWSMRDGKTFASISKIETYFHCPFRFFCQHVLGLRENKSAEPNVADLGSFTHRVLEIFFGENTDFDMSEAELYSLIDEISDRVLAEEEFSAYRDTMTEGGIEHVIFERNRYIVRRVVECVRASDFGIEDTELRFGLGEGLPPLELDDGNGRHYYMRGVIDRVDRYGDYVVLVDYKSKSKVDFGLKEIYYGERVQLLLYLNAYCRHNDCTPLALYYLPMPYGYKKEDDSVGRYRYTGITRNLEEGISHYDRKYKDRNASHIPVEVSSKGEIKENKLFTKADFDIVREYADKVILQAVAEMESGYISPRSTDCDYCKYGNICGVKDNKNFMRRKAGVVLKAEEGDNGRDSVE